VVYVYGIIRHTGVLAIGGDHVSNDLGHGLKVSLSRAEKLKCEHGAAVVQAASKGHTITLAHELNLPARTINHEHLQRIMSLRLEEIFQIIAEDLEQAGLLDYLGAGVFIGGGGARIPHLAQLAESVFKAPAFLGQTNSISGLKSALDQPEFLTAIGLVKYASLKSRRRPAGGFLSLLKNQFGRVLSLFF
jgi:cell division protein FtsA